MIQNIQVNNSNQHAMQGMDQQEISLPASSHVDVMSKRNSSTAHEQFRSPMMDNQFKLRGAFFDKRVANVNTRNPYSILTQNSPEDFMKETSLIQEITGARTTRANALRQLHIKKSYGEHMANNRLMKSLYKTQQMEEQ